MSLTFPTQAEQALEEFKSNSGSLAKIAARRGATIERRWPSEIEYTFDDDTSLVTRGRGRAHQIQVLLP